LIKPKTFTAGVDPAKIRVVPEAIDTELWDPARYSPVNLSRLGLVQATGPPCDPNTSLPAPNMLRGKLPVTGKKPFGEHITSGHAGREITTMLCTMLCMPFSCPERGTCSFRIIKPNTLVPGVV
jgi:hypothetical protein